KKMPSQGCRGARLRVACHDCHPEFRTWLRHTRAMAKVGLAYSSSPGTPGEGIFRAFGIPRRISTRRRLKILREYAQNDTTSGCYASRKKRAACAHRARFGFLNLALWNLFVLWSLVLGAFLSWSFALLHAFVA